MRLTVVEVVLVVLAVARVTQLIGRDALTGPLRARWFKRQYGRDSRYGADVDDWTDLDEHWSRWDALVDADGVEAPAFAHLVRCVWCVGFHVSWVWVVGWAVWPVGGYWASLVLAVSWLIVFAHNLIGAVAAAADR